MVDAEDLPPMPYDAPLWDLAGILHAVHPTEGYFQNQTGTIQVADDGAMSFAPGAGKHSALKVDPATREKTLKTLIEVASAKIPPPQPPRFRPPQAAPQNVQQEKKPETPATKQP